MVALGLGAYGVWRAGSPVIAAQPKEKGSPDADFEQRFQAKVRPFVERYCAGCHGKKSPEASLDLTQFASAKAVAGDLRRWKQVLERLETNEMPPEEAPRRPMEAERAAVVAWIRNLSRHEADRNAGDPGVVLARRLSNAEFDYTIRDLTGVDIRPAKEFPVDPANEAGFDNTGESLAMSPALFKKYLAAARLVADHVVLKPDGFVFAPHPIVTDTDRDKYCVQRIIDFYGRHAVDLADYFHAAWKYRHREALGKPSVTLDEIAADARLSSKYLKMLWSGLAEKGADIGPVAGVRKMWNELPGPRRSNVPVRADCEKMRDAVVRLRKQLKPDVKKMSVTGISPGSQPLVLWRNQQYAARHRSYGGDVAADLKKLGEPVTEADTALPKQFLLAGDKLDPKKLRGEFERFCELFPDAFVVTDRGPYFSPGAADKGRPLTAGFHLMQGYFRDDTPLCELILDEKHKLEIDELWRELDFITLAPMRQYRDFIFFERAEPPRFMFEAEFDFARSEDRDCVSQAKIERLAKSYLAKARDKGAKADALEAIQHYFTDISAQIRRVERGRLDAEPSHLRDLTAFAERAYRRPLSVAERDGIVTFYKKLRSGEQLGHEDALRDTIVSVLLSPHFCYRVDLGGPGAAVQPLTDHALASRLSYFLWSSMPDAELLAHAAAGDLHQPAVLTAQTRRMLRDPKARGLATEFLGNWLDFRRFEEHNAVDRDRFPSFTNELRQAMFEEPIRYFQDVMRRNRSVLDLIDGHDTFVNRPLAKHYGMPEPAKDEWIHVSDADRHGRGGLLPMAVFLTKNAPGLRTSPVKRGYWVVRRLRGEQIPPPPPTVPELPKDEAGLGELTLPQVLARHRADKACAGCHRRFDSVGLVFEDFGPIGERRTKDLGGRPVSTLATFPDGKDRTGLAGLRAYLHEKRHGDFVDNLCSKLFSYALGRGLLPSDQKALDAMKARLASEGFAFGSLVESSVTSPQFMNRRADVAARK
jgi:hypothetical protein